MKAIATLITCSAFLLSVCPDIHAQSDYKPLLNQTAVWNFERRIECLPYTPYYGFNYSLIPDGDTTVGELQYAKLHRPAWEFFVMSGGGANISPDDCGPSLLPTNGYLGALREDNEERKVWFLPAGAQEEKLLYDFNLEVGDTLDFYFASEHFWEVGITPVIAQIDSVWAGNAWHKRWRADIGQTDDWLWQIELIEGIGGMHGLIDPDPFFHLHGPVTNLTCYSNDQGTSHPADAGPCQLITSLHEVSKEHIDWQLFPNPASGHFHIQLPDDHILHGCAIEIFDMSGRSIYTQENVNNPHLRISTDNWQSGMYLVMLRNDEVKLFSRIVVQ